MGMQAETGSSSASRSIEVVTGKDLRGNSAKEENDAGKYQSRDGQGLDIMTELPLGFTAATSTITGVVGKPNAISRKICCLISGWFELVISAWTSPSKGNFCIDQTAVNVLNSVPPVSGRLWQCSILQPTCAPGSSCHCQLMQTVSLLQALMGTSDPDSWCNPPRMHQDHTIRRNISCVSHCKQFWGCFSLFYNPFASKCSLIASNPLLPKLLCLRYSLEMPSHRYHTSFHCHSFTDTVSKRSLALGVLAGLWNENSKVICSTRAALWNCRGIVKRRESLFPYNMDAVLNATSWDIMSIFYTICWAHLAGVFKDGFVGLLSAGGLATWTQNDFHLV